MATASSSCQRDVELRVGRLGIGDGERAQLDLARRHDVIGNVFEYCAGLPESVAERDRERLVAGRGGSWWCSAGTCDFYNLADIGMMDRHGSLANQGFRAGFDPAQLGQ